MEKTNTDFIHRLSTGLTSRRIMIEKYKEDRITKKIIGIAFDIYNKIGGCYPEKVYQNAFREKFKEEEIKYYSESYCKIELDGVKIGGFRLDFLIEDQVVVEIKVRDEFYKKDFAQILAYLRVHKIKVGLIILITSKTVKIKRFVL